MKNLSFGCLTLPHDSGRAGRVCLTVLVLWLIFNVADAAPKIHQLGSGQEVIGVLHSIAANRDDTLIEIALEFDLGYEELVAANPHLDPWLPVEGGEVILPLRFILPADPKNALYINLAEYRAYYFPEKNKVMSFPISIGRGGWQTPAREKGNVVIEDKIVDPNWYPPESVREEHRLMGDILPLVVLPGPDNPLGKYALKLSIPGYFIHGTNRPYGIGMQVTHGCIRLRPPDIKLLFDGIPRQTPVFIHSDPFKVGVQDEVIYFEANPNLQHRLSEEDYQKALTAAVSKMIAASTKLGQSLDWQKIFEIAKQRRGIAWAVNFHQETPAVKPLSPSARTSTQAFIQAQQDDLF